MLLGFFLLGGVPFSPLNVLGICINTVGGGLQLHTPRCSHILPLQVGGVWYSVFKYQEKLYRRTVVASASVDPYNGSSMESSVAVFSDDGGGGSGHRKGLMPHGKDGVGRGWDAGRGEVQRLPHSASGPDVEGAAAAGALLETTPLLSAGKRHGIRNS